MWKRFASFSLALVFSALLAVSSYAATMPAYDAVDKTIVDYTEMLDADKAVWLDYYNSVTDSYYQMEYDADWHYTKLLPSWYDRHTFVGYYLRDTQARMRNLTNIYNINKLRPITNDSKLDWYFQMEVAIWYPESYGGAVFSGCSVYPIYTSLTDSTISQGDTDHTFTLAPTSKTLENDLTDPEGRKNWQLLFDFTEGNNVLAVPSIWIPDGYYLSGFAFVFTINELVDFPSPTFFGFSEMHGSGYHASGSATQAIEEMTERLEDAIDRQTQELTEGWVPSPSTPAGSGAITDYEDAEQALLQSQQGGVDAAGSLFDSLGSNLLRFKNGFGFITALFGRIVDNTWISTILYSSLALGIVAFLLNITPSLIRKFTNRGDGG